ncbi:MAG: hypothetical protein AAGF86_02320 [Pseudomonadota bacterium]
MAAKTPEWGYSRLFRLSDGDFEEANFSKVLVIVLRRLESAFPDQVDLTSFEHNSEFSDTFTDLWNWLVDQGVLTGPLSNCAMTLVGRQSYQAALAEHPKVAAGLQDEGDALDPMEASLFLLSVLRNQHERSRRDDPEE